MPSASLDIAQPPPVAQRQRSCRSSVDAEPHSLHLHLFCSLRFPWKLLYFHFCLREGQRGEIHVAGSGNNQVTYDSGQNLTHAKDPDQRMHFFFYIHSCMCMCVCVSHGALCIHNHNIEQCHCHRLPPPHTPVSGKNLPVFHVYDLSCQECYINQTKEYVNF